MSFRESREGAKISSSRLFSFFRKNIRENHVGFRIDPAFVQILRDRYFDPKAKEKNVDNINKDTSQNQQQNPQEEKKKRFFTQEQLEKSIEEENKKLINSDLELKVIGMGTEARVLVFLKSGQQIREMAAEDFLNLRDLSETTKTGRVLDQKA